MNKANVLKLAEHIECLDPEEYDQTQWRHWPCHTPACIAGHAVWLAGKWHRMEDEEFPEVMSCARRWLGLEIPEAEELFDENPMEWGDTPTPQEAAATLRHLAETGEVRWQRATP